MSITVISRGAVARIARFYPVLVVLLSLAVLDQVLLHLLLNKEAADAESFVPVNYRDYVNRVVPDRPQLIILGSSRGRDAVDARILQGEVDAAHLPYPVFNLSQGDGGTPSALLASMQAYTAIFKALPPGSRVLYLYSFFEMNHVRDQSMLWNPQGVDMLLRFVFRSDHWVHRLRDRSGFARYASERRWKSARGDARYFLEVPTAPIALRFR